MTDTRPRPWLCRLGIHTSRYLNVTGNAIGPIFLAERQIRCSKCHTVLSSELGPES
ncbi:hypothetical protein SEA_PHORBESPHLOWER_40 [Gordonia phage PhorbesPhlower]|nr:hypothetical protein SEA_PHORBESPHLOWER_40 [Gordonia phage PhorbesPhlower]